MGDSGLPGSPELIIFRQLCWGARGRKHGKIPPFISNAYPLVPGNWDLFGKIIPFQINTKRKNIPPT